MTTYATLKDIITGSNLTFNTNEVSLISVEFIANTKKPYALLKLYNKYWGLTLDYLVDIPENSKGEFKLETIQKMFGSVDPSYKKISEDAPIFQFKDSNGIDTIHGFDSMDRGGVLFEIKMDYAEKAIILSLKNGEKDSFKVIINNNKNAKNK
jgi:hypothetical protein